MIVVARGGGSLADLFAFCDETLCRTVALLRVPVISSRRPSHGPHAARRRRRRGLLDAHARRGDGRAGGLRRRPGGAGRARAARLERQGRRAVLERARTLSRLSPRPRPPRRAPPDAAAPAPARAARRDPPRRRRPASAPRSRARPCWRASPPRRPPPGDRAARRARADATALDRTASAALERRRRDLDRLLATLAAHDPQRTLERGYALLEDPAGEPVTSAEAARAQPSLTVRLHDGRGSPSTRAGRAAAVRRLGTPSRRRARPRRRSCRPRTPRRRRRRRTRTVGDVGGRRCRRRRRRRCGRREARSRDRPDTA